MESESRTVRTTISLTETERSVIIAYANKYFTGNVSRALIYYPLKISGVQAGYSIADAANNIDASVSSIERKLSEGLSIREVSEITSILELKDRVLSMYTSVQEIYGALLNIPHIKKPDGEKL